MLKELHIVLFFDLVSLNVKPKETNANFIQIAVVAALAIVYQNKIKKNFTILK